MHAVVSVVSDSENFWTVAQQAPLSMGFSRQEYWRRLPFPPPGDLPDIGIKLASPVSSALQADSLPAETFSRLLLHYITCHIIVFAYYYTFHLMLHIIIK